MRVLKPQQWDSIIRYLSCSQIAVNAGRFPVKFRRLMTPLVRSDSRVRIKEQNEHHGRTS
jgi:hypothetical protein